MSDEFEFADKGNKIIYETEGKGFNPGLIVLLVVGGLLLTFLVGNYVLYSYAQKTLPPRKRSQYQRRR
ncbi:DNA-binding S1FA2 [Gossypium arboreum]|uniref:DNA-binding S1FA2 n=1 Tax=Gossypium arboreum TaxID=29729 RepID=A0A0B0N2V0_GOSAR|nr:DNA-binding S1FA2 [Gossypium arboreum]